MVHVLYLQRLSRLVVVLFHVTYTKLAAAEPNEGATELVGLHRQLRQVLSAKEKELSEV